MKKIFVVLLGLALVLSMSGIASAAEPIKYDTVDKTGTATVSLSLHSIYTVTLPGNIPLNYNGNDAFVGNSSFDVDIQRLGANEYMNITVKGTNSGTDDNKWYLKYDENPNTIEYQLGVGTQGNHIGSNKNRELTKTNNKLVEDTNTSVKDYYLHARVLYSTVETLDLTNEEYTDILTFTVNIGTY